MFRQLSLLVYGFQRLLYLAWYRVKGPPRILRFSCRLNADILRHFGAAIGRRRVRLHSPICLHEAEKGYGNLTIQDGCILNGNNFLDLSAPITLEEGVSLGPGVVIMTHNRYNYNRYLEERMAATCGRRGVLIHKGAGIKAGAVITMGVTIGEDAVVAAGAVVNRSVESRSFVAGIPARSKGKIDDLYRSEAQARQEEHHERDR